MKKSIWYVSVDICCQWGYPYRRYTTSTREPVAVFLTSSRVGIRLTVVNFS